jgi:uncharacterized protein (TIGR03437 family)
MRYFCVSLLMFATVASAQTAVLSCNATAVPTTVRAEGLAERMGDIVLSCAGGPAGGQVAGNVVLSLNTAVSNHLASDGTTDVALTVNNGGATPLAFAARTYASNSVMFPGVIFNTSAQGTAELRFSNLRGNASQFGFTTAPVPVQASLSFTGSGLTLPASTFVVAYAERGLYAIATSRLVCDQAGSPWPGTITVSTLLATSAAASVRVTEGYAAAFTPLADASNLRADSGTRIVVRHSGLAAGARLFVPDVIAGSDADVPTSMGDLGTPASGGRYTPNRGQLLLVRVTGADANGAGGRLVMPAPTVPSAFDSAGELTIAGGAGVAVYEVVDANSATRESAQFPAFLGLAPNSGATGTEAALSVNLGPLSNVVVQSATAPIPRFFDTPPPIDCTLVGDCGASYFPRLAVGVTDLHLAAPRGGAATGYIPVRNGGGGTLLWRASVVPTEASSWLTLAPSSGVNNATIRVDARGGFFFGPSSANIVIDAGPIAGSRTVAVTLDTGSISTPSVRDVINAAGGDERRLVPGSLATVMGSGFSSQPVKVTFDGLQANLLYVSDAQVNLQVPAALEGNAAAGMVVSNAGGPGAPYRVTLAASAPVIFPGAVLNQDWTPNGPSAPAPKGSVVQIFVTGLPQSGSITARVHDRDVSVPEYGGPAPGLTGVQQVNVRIPPDLPTMQSYIYVCGDQTCSPAALLWIE